MSLIVETEKKALLALLDLAGTVYYALDDSEEIDGGSLIDTENADQVTRSMESLAALPDDRPGYTMGPAAKASWALRRILPGASVREVDHCARRADRMQDGAEGQGTSAAILAEISGERQRQIDAEGFTHTHDDEHNAGELAAAGACYALMAANEIHPYSQGDGDWREVPPESWPWEVEAWKPKGARRDLIRAAALLVAEIERMDRAAAQEPGGHRHVP